MKRPALFLDRDGVINVDYGYVHTPEEFQFVDGIFEVVANANQAGYLAVVVTNQAGIGRGYYSESQFHVLIDWMKDRFADRGGKIDAVYFSPYHPEHVMGQYRRDTDCRKPGPGMLLQAERDLDVDMGRSIFIGDKPSDMAAGRAAGVGTLLLLDGEANDEGCFTIKRLYQALPYLSAAPR
jgi:D-glycero-D-manno-heptose 1,7-bisphosphate phosphatase